MVTPLTADRFHAFSAQHYVLMLITAVGVVVAIWWGRSHRGTSQEVMARRGFASVGLLVTVGMQIYWLTPGVRDVRNSWPLQLSDLADYTAAYALWTRGLRTSAFTYYVGLSLTLAAVITPALTQPFPDPRWFGFWARHIFVVWAAVYLVWGLGIRPTWRLYRTTVVAVLGWAVVAYVFNVVMGTNYGYLVETPSTSTPLDLLGPWPWYVLGAMAILLTLWAVVFTLPWERARARAAATGAGSLPRV
ncbi:YwaF family protein [Nocardioides sp. Iso805N]|uniref:YwaF family protein n=1 Tax=Nocardioides sp. Iso805N TaxID=1283287 RepID=UPI00037D831D|nr:TIGR02206 family membrane protein [Nocardioides sp. Iso805N]